MPSPRPASPSFAFNGVVRFTKIGTGYLVFTFVIGFAALNTGNNSLYIGLTFMLGCLLLSGIASKGGLKHLEMELVGVEDAWAGRPAEGTLRITNRSPIWSVRDVVVTSEDLAEPLFFTLVPRRSHCEGRASFLFLRRGEVELKRVDLYTRYPFGFFLKKRRVRLSGKLVVYPELLDDSFARERFRNVDGDATGANRPGPGTEVLSFRDYTPGDSLRQVYWRKSASLGRWITKQTELEAAQAVHVVVDPYQPPGASEEQFERMISEAATFIHEAIERGIEVILSLPRTNLHARDAEGARPMFHALALLEPAHEPLFHPLDRSTTVFAVRRADEPKSA
ncbi:MAG TPA: DUF58 domain-containing protein [Thermoanaerobaculia bacterium]|nr:DUF58 domain-containing protein [Thermoanaerobaculia bacterium]